MWDAWAAYDPTADGYFVTEKLSASDPTGRPRARRRSASPPIGSCSWRYGDVADLAGAPRRSSTRRWPRSAIDPTSHRRTATPRQRSATGSPRPSSRSARPTDRRSRIATSTRPTRRSTSRWMVGEPGTTMVDPNRWQPLALDKQLSQNGLPIPGKVQTFDRPAVGPRHAVRPAALDDGTPIDPGAPPRLADPSTSDDFKQAALEVIRYSSMLDADGRRDDRHRRRARIGDNSLGTNDGDGTSVNPVTGQPYEPNDRRCGPTSRACSPSSGRTGRSRRRRRATGTSSPTRSSTRRASSAASAARAPSSTRSSGTSRCTWRSTAPSTTPPSRPGA